MGDLGESGRVVQPAAIPGRSMAVLYGSETGNAEDIAVELARTAERLHFQTTVDEMDGFKLADVLRASLVIFVTSTTGQGEMPKNTLKFWKNLRREKLNNTNCLRSLRFAIFGLGDSSYLKFNWSARKLRARLLQLGATEFFRPGEGDERHDNGIDSIYLPWYEELKTTLLTDYPLPDSTQPIPDDVQLPPKYPLEMLPAMQIRLKKDYDARTSENAEDERRFQAIKTKSAVNSHVDRHPSKLEILWESMNRQTPEFPAHIARQDHTWERENPRDFSTLDKNNILKDHPKKYLLEPRPAQTPELPPGDILPIPRTYKAILIRNERVTPADHWQDVRHLVFDVPLPNGVIPKALCDAGGHITLVIWPKNYPEDVNELVHLMGWEAAADTPLELKSAPRGLFPTDGDLTLRSLLTHNLDITAVPKRNFLRELTHYTSDEREKERLEELISPLNQQEFYDYTSRPRRTIIEVLRDFTGVKIPPERALEMFAVIRGREFSVCNAGDTFVDAVREDAMRIELLVALVEYKTIIRKPRQGLCSRYLKHLTLGAELAVRIQISSGTPLRKRDAWVERPLIAIATGTGIAPIRAIIQERASSLQGRSANSASTGPTLLFFGCRNRAADFHFEKEWPDYHPNLTVYPAFSRDSIEPDPDTTTTNAPPLDRVTTTIAALRPEVAQYDAHRNYVQHLIRKHAREVGALMRCWPMVVVCGNAGRMPTSVRSALLDALMIDGVVEDREEAERWLGDPENVTYWQETW